MGRKDSNQTKSLCMRKSIRIQRVKQMDKNVKCYSRKKYLEGEEGKPYIFLWVVGANIFQIIWVVGVRKNLITWVVGFYLKIGY